MRCFSRVEGITAVIAKDDVDSDQILPGSYLRGFKPDYAAGLFAYWRQDDGFILSQPGYRNTSILITGGNFGCGSTREQAVWALDRFGIRVIIGLGFAEIFRENLLKNAILPVILPADAHAAVAATALRLGSAAPMAVDLVSQSITAADAEPVRFELAAVERTALLEGLDEIGLTLQQVDEITAYEQRDRVTRPWLQSFNGF